MCLNMVHYGQNHLIDISPVKIWKRMNPKTIKPYSYNLKKVKWWKVEERSYWSANKLSFLSVIWKQNFGGVFKNHSGCILKTWWKTIHVLSPYVLIYFCKTRFSSFLIIKTKFRYCLNSQANLQRVPHFGKIMDEKQEKRSRWILCSHLWFTLLFTILIN